MEDDKNEEDTLVPPIPTIIIIFLHSHIDSLISTVEELQTTTHGLQSSMDRLTTLIRQVLTSQETLNACFALTFPPLPSLDS